MGFENLLPALNTTIPVYMRQSPLLLFINVLYIKNECGRRFLSDGGISARLLLRGKLFKTGR